VLKSTGLGKRYLDIHFSSDERRRGFWFWFSSERSEENPVGSLLSHEGDWLDSDSCDAELEQGKDSLEAKAEPEPETDTEPLCEQCSLGSELFAGAFCSRLLRATRE
jgi:hypothetical protein